LLVLLLGIAEVGFFAVTQLRSQNAVDVLAVLAANSPTWRTAVDDENRRSGCRAAPPQPDVAYPDGSNEPGSRVRLTWHCRYPTIMAPDIWPDGINYTVSAEAVIPMEVETSAPSPSPSL
jgi:hypothetical protein